jgi:uncharacterized protein (TIGR01777 family)
MYTVLITGGTGMIGTALSRQLLSEGYNVIILSRNPKETAASHPLGAELNFFRSTGSLYYSKWDVQKMTIDPTALAEADFIIHLAGAGVAAQRWSEERKREILESRTRSSELLLKALDEQPNKVRAVISASAIGYYGPDNGTPFTEEDKPSNDFLGSTCQQWEKSIDPVSQLNIRLVKMRLGIVLANEGGALKEFRKPLSMGVAAILGNGKQMVSWVHINDICRAFIYAMEHVKMKGVFNLTAPKPASNRELTLTLAKKTNKKFFIPIPVPKFVLKAMLGEMSIEVLKSATVNSQKIQSAGFYFLYPDIDLALADLTS